MAFDARVPQRGVLVTTERNHRLVHLLSIEHFEAYEQVEVLKECRTEVELLGRDFRFGVGTIDLAGVFGSSFVLDDCRS